MQPSDNSSKSDYVWPMAATAIGLPILAIAVFAAVARTDDIDAYLFAYYGKQLLAGQRLYADLWDNKPPGIFWVDAIALWFSGGKYAGVATACAGACVGSCIAFFLTARRLYGVPTAAIGAVMAAVYVFQHDYHVGSNRPNTFYVLFELGAMACYVHAIARRAVFKRWLFVAGFCVTAAVCFRQTAFSTPCAMVAHQMLLIVTKRATRAQAAAHLGALAVGSSVGALVVVGTILLTSDIGEAWHGVVSSNLGYFVQPGKSKLLPELYRWRDHLDILGLPLLLAAASLLHGIANRFQRDPRPPAGHAPPVSVVPAPLALITFWFGAALYLALIGPSKRMMYFGVALAPLTMLATHCVSHLFGSTAWDRRPRIARIVAVLWFVLMMTPAVAYQWRSARIAHFRRFDERALRRGEETASIIRRHSSPDDPIYVWGYMPPIYWYADRPLGQRYLVSTLVDQWLDRAQPFVDTVISDLKRAPPKVIVIGPAEMKTLADPPADHPVEYGDFADWVRSNYTPAPETKQGGVWIRRDGAP